MGNVNESQLQFCSEFDQAEINRLRKRFQKLDTDESNQLSVEELRQIPELNSNPLLERFIDVFDRNKNGEVDFEEFLRGISQFSLNTSKREKLKFAFKIYDVDGDNRISNSDFYKVMRMMIGREQMTDEQVQNVVDRTMIDADRNNSGSINFDEFCRCFGV